MKDKRYSITREWTGHVSPRWVVRFCGERIDEPAAFRSRAAATVRAVGHNAVRLGALVVVEAPVLREGGQP